MLGIAGLLGREGPAGVGDGTVLPDPRGAVSQTASDPRSPRQCAERDENHKSDLSLPPESGAAPLADNCGHVNRQHCGALAHGPHNCISGASVEVAHRNVVLQWPLVGNSPEEVDGPFG